MLYIYANSNARVLLVARICILDFYPSGLFVLDAYLLSRARALQRVFRHEAAHNALVIDNSTHLTTKSCEQCLNDLGCRHLFTVPQYLQLNALTQTFIFIHFFVKLDGGIDDFLI
ncbi:hypothetical protein T265_04547 [Opisthorchis viverrini]|uniref:Uncharacterized protein n=1 Tax=Opisthorchis viverrini TaxID=6198 RepID=A0A074ZS94_OPIVI|nr:hypothetical protein T265_04547 [Opisthorchis viverrini]KER28677.1 hypothetical protein T265_04547 [Opisthorchis viverrini]